VLCLKWMPAWAVTSVNSIGPEGRAGASLAAGAGGGTGTGVGSAGSELTVCGEELSWCSGARCLHPANARRTRRAAQQVTRILGIRSSVYLATKRGQPPSAVRRSKAPLLVPTKKLVELRSTGQPRAAVPTWLRQGQCAAASFSVLARRESSQISISIAVGPTMKSA